MNNPNLANDIEEVDNSDSAMDDGLAELRHLLLQPEQERLQELGERLEDPNLHAQDVSQVLPEAMLLSAKQGNKLSAALTPTIEKIIQLSIKRDIHSFADVLFPVIGPAIRKAISEALKQMVQSLNQTLDRSFSWQGMKWRLESMRSGKPFAEIVLLNSMLYRVEQVFLIHAQSGLLLQHVAADSEAFQDADLVSAMLTAIQDFIRDSFDMEDGNELNTIQMGDFTIWLVQGPQAVIAAAIRGNAPEDLRLVFNNALELIHLEQAEALQEFNGDASLIEAARPHLEYCLQTRCKEKSGKFSPLMALLLLTTLIVLGLWLFNSVREQLRWNDYVQQLKAEPGIIVTDIARQGGVYRVAGLRDPLAREATEILAGHEIEFSQVKHNFQPYQALSKELVLARAQRILAPPATVMLSFNNGVLTARGLASPQWITDTRLLARVLPGVLKFDASEVNSAIDLSPLAAPETVSLSLRNGSLTASGSAPYVWITTARNKALQLPGIAHYDDSNIIIEPDLSSLKAPDSVKLNFHNGTLNASGNAPHAWIVDSRKKAQQIPGISQYNDSDLQDLDLAQLQSLKLQLEQVVILFGVDAAAAQQENQPNGLIQLPAQMKRLLQIAQLLKRTTRILIIGHSDSSGRPHRNLELSRGRAEYVHYYLVSNGISSDYLLMRGAGTNEPVTDEDSEQGKRMNRSVTFKIHLTDTTGSIP